MSKKSRKRRKNVMRKRMQAALDTPPAESSKSKVTKRRKRASNKWVPTSADQLRASTIFQTGSQSHDEDAH
ncbi:hypothetical protein EJB05_12518 [Eragrostis curvula]|uniref:Uncharacterized protein n=1 Tax=Eragrostis curvula TaxID=38414 RepID=A0A5J9VTP2_9POAL|nr:hypothetical protein EJB05_12518 [Eragrostis curvula]